MEAPFLCVLEGINIFGYKEVIKMDVADHIRNFREGRGIYQKELAGLSYSFINDVENGRRTPSIESYHGLISEIERLQDRVKELEGKK